MTTKDFEAIVDFNDFSNLEPLFCQVPGGAWRFIHNHPTLVPDARLIVCAYTDDLQIRSWSMGRVAFYSRKKRGTVFTYQGRRHPQSTYRNVLNAVVAFASKLRASGHKLPNLGGTADVTAP